MRKNLLLMMLCLIGKMSVQAGITVIPPEESEDGSYVLTFKNTAAEGETMFSSWSDLPDYVKNATSVTVKTKDGYSLTHEDMVQIMGDNSDSYFTKLESLDMGDAKLVSNDDLGLMCCVKDGKGLNQLKYFVFPKTTTSIPLGMFNNNTVIEEIIMLEPDHESDPHMTTITRQAFQNCTNLSDVRIPDGITDIGENAFQYCAFEAISLPNSLKTIGSTAFGDCYNLKSVTIPASVESIGSSAFQKNTSMTDVYVIGNNVKIANGAFNENETYNFTYEEDGTVDFSDWKSDHNDGSNTPHPLCLHIPNNDEAKSRYINPYLRALNDPRLTDEMLNNFNANQDKIKAILQDYDGINPNSGIWYFQPNGTVPYVVMDGYRYFRKGNGKFGAESGGEYGATGDYAGWRNFMLVADDLTKKTWPDNRVIESRWYSAVFPFDLSYNQVMSVYGNGTDVREFTYVNQHKDSKGKDVRTVTFKTRPSIPTVTNGSTHEDKNKTGYIVKGRPYMIHPGVRSVPVEVNGTTVYRTIAGVDVSEATDVVNNNTDLEVVYRCLVDGDNSEKVLDEDAYYFKGTYQTQDLPANSFYLGISLPKYPLAFYVNKSVGANKWKEFTSIVQKRSASDPTAKTMDLDFKIPLVFTHETFGIATAIEPISVQSRLNDKRVYNLNGQVVANQPTTNLYKGVYVMNGKKIVVR